MSRLEHPDHLSDEELDEAARARALQFLIRTGQLGEAISAGIAARVGDREIVGNLTVILVAQLYLRGQLRPVEIQEIAGLSSGGVTKLLDRMEDLGLISRAHGQVASDRRAITVTLTDDGRRIARLLAVGLIDRIADVQLTLRELADAADGVAATAGVGDDPVVTDDIEADTQGSLPDPSSVAGPPGRR
jgi:DNA-binding MarR family transcriptional regulator